MQIFSLFLLLIGAVLLVSGFKKNNRVLLVVAAFVWLISGTWDEFSEGFKDGISANAQPTLATRAR
jgi:hypothetical protein